MTNNFVGVYLIEKKFKNVPTIDLLFSLTSNLIASKIWKGREQRPIPLTAAVMCVFALRRI
jgi:hypothetical protein